MVWGMMRPVRAKLLRRIREVHGNGVIEGVIWEVPEPVPPAEHRIKYRLVYLVEGRRVVGYDFVDAPGLIRDFLRDVKEVGS